MTTEKQQFSPLGVLLLAAISVLAIFVILASGTTAMTDFYLPDLPAAPAPVEMRLPRAMGWRQVYTARLTTTPGTVRVLGPMRPESDDERLRVTISSALPVTAFVAPMQPGPEGYRVDIPGMHPAAFPESVQRCRSVESLEVQRECRFTRADGPQSLLIFDSRPAPTIDTDTVVRALGNVFLKQRERVLPDQSTNVLRVTLEEWACLRNCE